MPGVRYFVYVLIVLLITGVTVKAEHADKANKDDAAYAARLIEESKTFDPETFQWKHLKEKKGLNIYKADTPGSEFPTYKAEGVLDKPWEVLFEVLLDIPSFPQWMPGCLESNVVKMIDHDRVKGHFVIHLLWDAIWPVKNRDLVLDIVSIHDWANDHVVVTLTNSNKYDDEVPVKKGFLRIKKFYAQYDFRYIDRTHTKVRFTTFVDPGGIVPPRIVSIQTAPISYDSLKALRKQADDSRYYKQAAVDYF